MPVLTDMNFKSPMAESRGSSGEFQVRIETGEVPVFSTVIIRDMTSPSSDAGDGEGERETERGRED